MVVGSGKYFVRLISIVVLVLVWVWGFFWLVSWLGDGFGGGIGWCLESFGVRIGCAFGTEWMTEGDKRRGRREERYILLLMPGLWCCIFFGF